MLHELAVRAPASGRRWRVALVDDVDRLAERPQDRTWCFWDRGGNPAEAALAASWDRVLVHPAPGTAPAGRPVGVPLVLRLAPLRYAMLRSADYYGLVADAVHAAAGSLDVVRLPSASAVDDDGDGVTVRTPGGHVRAAWVVDSRPRPAHRGGATTLLQHFHGAVVRTAVDAFDPDLPVLMDFRTDQPERGLSFGYCLPLGPRLALVEYTEFSAAVLDAPAYRAALDAYLRTLLPSAAAGAPVEVEHTETGVIPMTDAVHRRRTSPRVLLAGTAGGATRPSTGYTFRTMQRQAAAVVGALLDWRHPVPPRPYPRRHLLMDAAMLRGLDAGHLDGPDFFTRLFARNPTSRVLDVLDGATGLGAELALMATAPPVTMVRSGAEAVALRAARRLRGSPGGSLRGSARGR
ncbi:lycopene cyclase family protein [Thalassiella azotivora]